MRAVTWQGNEDIRVEDVPDPEIEKPTDAIITVTSTAICGSDLHLYSVLGPFLEPGDVLGHEAMGVVEEVGSEVPNLRPGARVVIPFPIACGHCWMCQHELPTQCETTQVRRYGNGAALFGYTKLYGQVPGGQAQHLRVPQAQYGPIEVPPEGPDEQYLYLSDVLPTAWQAVEYAQVPPGGTVLVLGLGPIGQMCVRIAAHRGASQVLAADYVPERLAMAARHGAEVFDLGTAGADLPAQVREQTNGRGPHSVIDAVGMEAHGSFLAESVQKMTRMLPDALAAPMTETLGVDRLAALQLAIACVRRGGTLSLSGVYGGARDPLPMLTMFDKQLTVRMGQANVQHWAPQLLPLLEGDDPLGVLDLKTHSLPLEKAPEAYRMFQRKEDGCLKVVLDPGA